LQLLSAYATLLPPTLRCCRCRHHAAAALPNALLLLLKMRFCQAAISAAKLKLAAAALLLPPPPLPLRCHCRATTAYKIKQYVILVTDLFFTTMVTAVLDIQYPTIIHG
jgi:hypothetical protein